MTKPDGDVTAAIFGAVGHTLLLKLDAYLNDAARWKLAEAAMAAAKPAFEERRVKAESRARDRIASAIELDFALDDGSLPEDLQAICARIRKGVY